MVPQSIACLARLLQLLQGQPQIQAEPKITAEPIKYRPVPRDVMIHRELTKYNLARQIEKQKIEP